MKKAAPDMEVIWLHKYSIKNAKHQKNLQLLYAVIPNRSRH